MHRPAGIRENPKSLTAQGSGRARPMESAHWLSPPVEQKMRENIHLCLKMPWGWQGVPANWSSLVRFYKRKEKGVKTLMKYTIYTKLGGKYYNLF